MTKAKNEKISVQRLLSGLEISGYLPAVRDAKARAGVFASSSDSDSTESDVAAAIRLLQRFYGFPETGKADEQVIAILKADGCGIADPVGPAALESDPGVWASPNLTYQFDSVIPGANEGLLRSVVASAFSIWSSASILHFTEVDRKGDIRIVFGAGDHGDPYPFDGMSGVLAHAFYPIWNPPHLAGDVHFDLSETWSLAPQCPPNQKDLMSVAVHEIGHAVGMQHSPEPASVMFAKYAGVRRLLHNSDIANIRRLYP